MVWDSKEGFGCMPNLVVIVLMMSDSNWPTNYNLFNIFNIFTHNFKANRDREYFFIRPSRSEMPTVFSANKSSLFTYVLNEYLILNCNLSALWTKPDEHTEYLMINGDNKHQWLPWFNEGAIHWWHHSIILQSQSCHDSKLFNHLWIHGSNQSCWIFTRHET